MKLIRERSLADRQEALNLAFLALRNRSDNDESDSSLVDVKDIRKALQILRPHYNDAKVRLFYPRQNSCTSLLFCVKLIIFFHVS